MSFVYPNFLWAYCLIAIPIIIHLFNFRRYKNIYFSRVKFLKEITEDSKSGLKLKHLLVLASRILAILCLVTAFAQPYIPTGDNQKTENITSIYLDNSFSMQAIGQDGNLLNEVKNQAIELVRSFEENEKINLLTSDLLSIHQRFYTKSEIIEMIKEIELSPNATPLSTVLNTQTDLLTNQDEAGNNRIFLMSDFQKSTFSLDGFNRPEIPTYIYKASPELTANIFIDSAWFITPVHRLNTPIEIHFRLRNISDFTDSISVSLSINGNEPGPKKVGIPANSYADSKIIFTDRTPGIKQGVLRIATSQLFFDDELFFTYEIKEEVKILIIKDKTDNSTNLEQLYGLDSYYNASTTYIDEVTQEDFGDKELIIFQNINKIPSGILDITEGELSSGASIVLIPGSNIHMESWNSFFSQHNLPIFTKMDTSNIELNYFNSDDPLYNGVFETTPKNYDFSKVFSKYDLSISNSNNFITLFGSSISAPFLYYSREGSGKIIVMTTPMNENYTNFQNEALGATTFLRFAETASFEKPLYSMIGEIQNFPLNEEIDEKSPIHFLNKENNVDVIPQIITSNLTSFISFSHLDDKIKQGGFYQLTDNKNFNEIIGLNYNRSESYIESFKEEEVLEMFKAIGWNQISPLVQNEKGQIEINTLKAKEYWRILLILGLIFIAIEILLLKLWKT